MPTIWLCGGFAVALGRLWTPESMPSICLQYGFAVALRWLWGGFGLRSLGLVYAYNMALRWLCGGFGAALTSLALPEDLGHSEGFFAGFPGSAAIYLRTMTSDLEVL